MFRKISSLLKQSKNTHPLGSIQGVESLLAELPQTSPLNLLLDIDNWIEDIHRFDDEVSPLDLRAALFRLDEFARPAMLELTSNYFAASKKEHLTDAAWVQLERHNKHLFSAYMHCLEAVRKDPGVGENKLQLALCAARALRALSTQKKLLHFRYRTPDAAWWVTAHNVLGFAAQLGITSLVQKVYADDAELSSPIQNYLIGLYLELAPVSNLLPVQLEIINRWLEMQTTVLDFNNTPRPDSSHYIDMANCTGPKRIRADIAAAEGRYFCACTRLRSRVTTLAAMLRKEKELPEWIAALEAKQKQLRALPALLLDAWSNTPPTRSADRQPEAAALKVAHGYSLTLRMIAASQFARKGNTVIYGGSERERQYNVGRFGLISPIANDAEPEQEEEKADTPMETLLKMETAGDIQMMESWQKVDVSETGMGVIVSSLRSRHRIGELVCFREQEELYWRLAVLRRIGRDPQNRLYMGLEFLPWPSLPARLTFKKEGSKTGWDIALHGNSNQLDVILIQADGNELLLPKGIFRTGMEMELIADRKRQNIRLNETLDTGEDWERVGFMRTASTQDAPEKTSG